MCTCFAALCISIHKSCIDSVEKVHYSSQPTIILASCYSYFAPVMEKICSALPCFSFFQNIKNNKALIFIAVY